MVVVAVADVLYCVETTRARDTIHYAAIHSILYFILKCSTWRICVAVHCSMLTLVIDDDDNDEDVGGHSHNTYDEI